MNPALSPTALSPAPDTPDAEARILELAHSLSLEQQVRLLTGADVWCPPAHPGNRAEPRGDVGRAVRRPRRRLRRAPRLRLPAVVVGPVRHLERGNGAPLRPLETQAMRGSSSGER